MNQLTKFQENEINLKDLVKLVRLSFGKFRQNISTIFTFALLVSFIGFLISFFSMPKYKAELRFILKSEGSGLSLNGLGMIGSLGSVLGANTTSPLERTIEIASSDRIIGSALLSEVYLNGKKEVLANSLIKLNKLNEVWEKDTILKNVQFSVIDSSIEQMSFPKRKAIKKLEKILIPKTGKGIISKSFDKKSGIVTIGALHYNEEFAIVLTKEVFSKLKDFYVEQITTSASNNVLVLQKKVDSIKLALSIVQSLYARSTDQSLGLLLQEDKVELKKLAIREQILLAMYAEAQKNLEAFKFMNDSAIPSLTVIDMPYSPVKKVERNILIFMLGGFFIGGGAAFFLILFRHWYKNLMAS